MNLNRLNTSFCILYINFNACAVCHRTLAEITQDISVQQNIRTAIIGDYKTKSLYGVKPLNTSLYPTSEFIFFGHFFPTQTVFIPQDCLESCDTSALTCKQKIHLYSAPCILRHVNIKG